MVLLSSVDLLFIFNFSTKLPTCIYIININITESEEQQVKSLEKQLQLVV